MGGLVYCDECGREVAGWYHLEVQKIEKGYWYCSKCAKKHRQTKDKVTE